MSYLPSIVLVAIGLLMLGLLLFRVARVLRRFSRATSMVAANTQDRAGLIRARSAGVRVAIQQRRSRNRGAAVDATTERALATRSRTRAKSPGHSRSANQ